MPASDMPLVSIVIPTYNHRRYVCDAVDSALGQTYPNCEVIVIDDGSTDGTGEMLRERYGDRIRYVYQDNRGLPAARNAGTRHACGVYVNYCDADDQLLPEKIARCVEVFAEHPDAGAVYTDYESVAEDGHTILPRSHPVLPSGNIFCELLIGKRGNFIMEAAPLVRRNLILDAGGFNEDMTNAQDWEMWVRLASRYPFIYIHEPLALYRYVPNAMHTNALGMSQSRLKLYQLARDYPGREDCIDDAAYDRLLAGRHHVLGLVCWRMNRRAEARDAFRAAIRLDPEHSTTRRLYVLLSYVLPVGAVRLVGWLRGLGPLRSGTGNKTG